jgi:endonuclease G
MLPGRHNPHVQKDAQNKKKIYFCAMALSKNQRFGLITFFLLAAAAILVTLDPWKVDPGDLVTHMAGAPPAAIRIELPDLAAGYPFSIRSDTIHHYTGFDLAYNETYEQAAWVAYVLTRKEVESGFYERSDDFRADTSISSGSATLADYRGSGYDRGHLAPAADMKWDLQAMSESFLLSNMSPQEPSFNRGIWSKLEDKVRDWAVEKDSIYVVTGPVLSTIQSSIGANEVGVPAYYFKVLADLSPPQYSIIAFLLPNKASRKDLLSFAITVDSLERFTGYDFFSSAPDQQSVEWLEGHLDINSWK